MKLIYLLILTVGWQSIVYSQQENIQYLEANLATKSGVEFINDAILLSKLYFDSGKYELSALRADEAYEASKKESVAKTAATALSLKGRSLTKLANGKKAVLNRAYRCFEESNTYTSEKSVRLDNFQNMKIVAAILGREKDLANIDYNIALLKGEENVPPPPADIKSGLFNSKKKALQEFQRIRTEKLTLEEELSDLSEEQAALRDQQRSLINILEVKESAILNMSEEQIKQELLLSEQERLLDSLTFSSILDSFELSQKQMIVEQQNSELREQEAELSLQKSQRNFLLAIAGLVLLGAVGLYHRYHVMKGHNAVLAEKNAIITEERKRSEELLLNILPKVVADELKSFGQAKTQHYDNATVLFADFIGFSKISKQLTPQQLVNDLDHAFRNFDAVIEKYNLEKIKTIGDAYMCAGGVPNENESHPVNVVKAALEMQEFLSKWNASKKKKGEPLFEARIGIHTGPLVAGVVGSTKFAYDIWGDTVNVASRMETSCEAGKVNISSSTYSKISTDFACEYRGKVPAKNVGEVEMYYVENPS